MSSMQIMDTAAKNKFSCIDPIMLILRYINVAMQHGYYSFDLIGSRYYNELRTTFSFENLFFTIYEELRF